MEFPEHPVFEKSKVLLLPEKNVWLVEIASTNSFISSAPSELPSNAQ
jgi:hypothetical protein